MPAPPPFLEQRNPDAFKHNVLPALGPAGSGLSSSGPRSSNPPPGSPRSARLASAPGAQGVHAPSIASEGHYPARRSGARSASSSASSIASGVAHSLAPPSLRDSSPPAAHPSSSKSGTASSTVSAPLGPPSSYVPSPSAISNYGSPQIRSSAHPAPYHNGSAPNPAAAGSSSAAPYQGYISDASRHYAETSSAPHELYGMSGPPPPIPAPTGRGEAAGSAHQRHGHPDQGRHGGHFREEAPAYSNGRTESVSHVGSASLPQEGIGGHIRHSDFNDSEMGPGGQQKGAGQAADASKGGGTPADRKVSCLECRSSKVKCTGKTSDDAPCARCQRIGRPCVFEKHRRGRRPDNLKFQKLEKSLETVTRAFNDYRKQNEPKHKPGDIAKLIKGAEVDEQPAKKKARRSTGQPSSELLLSEHAPMDHPHLSRDQDERGARHMSQPPPGGPSSELLTSHHHEHQHLVLARPDHQASRRDTSKHASGPGASHGSLPQPATHTAQGVGRPIPLPADSRSRVITIGVHVPLPDGDLGCDPIARNVITLREAHEFFGTFMHLQNSYFPSLDPALHSFDWVRDRSPFLLCVICVIAARLTEVGNSASGRLQSFLDQVLIPEVWTKGLRSVEIVQGFTLLAASHDLPLTAADDRTWQYLSFAYGQGLQLGLNRRVKLPDTASVLEQRLARNGERCWYILFLVESMSAVHMGRRTMFTIDRLIGASDSWHIHPEALPADRNLVALLQLRRTQARLYDLFESTIADPCLGEPALTAYRYDIFIRTCTGELETWKASWYDSITWAPHEQGVSREILFAYLSALLHQSVLALRTCPDPDASTSILRQLSRTAVDALNVLILFDWPDLVFAVNQNVVVASYCAILALRMTTHERRWRGAGAIDPLYVFDLVDKLVGSLSRPGGTVRRSATALSYASYLAAILNQYQEGYEATISANNAASASGTASTGGGPGIGPGTAPGPSASIPFKRRRGSEMNAHEFEAGPAGVTMIPKHPHSGLPTLVPPERPSLFSDMTFFDSFF